MTYRKIMFFTIISLLILATGSYIGGSVVNKDITSDLTSTNDYPLLAQRLFVENPSDTRINFSELRRNLNEYFKTNQINGSVYFEYLPTGTSIRVNSDERYQAASLIKLPVAMELYKVAELGKVNLDQKVILKQEWLNSGFGELYKKGAGFELSLRKAVEIMLVESDNTALRAVLSVTETALENDDRALSSLDIEYDVEENSVIEIGTRSYSSFLKCLYFACYNTKTDSQEILNYLTKTPFNQRIVAGIDDKEVRVAHKIGVFNTQLQSDCGIVYLDKSNYLLCIMIVGNDNPLTNASFVEISDFVYKFMTRE